jgi:hypothetical protein
MSEKRTSLGPSIAKQDAAMVRVLQAQIAALTARLEAAEAREITDDMVHRAAVALCVTADPGGPTLAGDWETEARAALEAALTPPATETQE